MGFSSSIPLTRTHTHIHTHTHTTLTSRVLLVTETEVAPVIFTPPLHCSHTDIHIHTHMPITTCAEPGPCLMRAPTVRTSSTGQHACASACVRLAPATHISACIVCRCDVYKGHIPCCHARVHLHSISTPKTYTHAQGKPCDIKLGTIRTQTHTCGKCLTLSRCTSTKQVSNRAQGAATMLCRLCVCVCVCVCAHGLCYLPQERWLEVHHCPAHTVHTQYTTVRLLCAVRCHTAPVRYACMWACV